MSIAWNAYQDPAQTADELAEYLAQQCNQAHPTGNGWQACCPAHEDDKPSLSIKPTTDKVLLKCHAGCTVDAIVASLGMTTADLFVNTTPPKSRKRIVKIYDYLDGNGHVLHQTVRYMPKDFKQRRPHPAKPREYIWSLKEISPVLYHLLDVLIAVHRGETVYLCEGEKDADNVQALGLTATCNAMGAGKWEAQYTETLRGADVVMLLHNDTPGRNHGELVARALAGMAASVKVLALPNLPEQGDVSDWLAAGGDRAQLEALVAQMSAWTPVGALDNRPRFQTISAKALYAKKLPPQEMIIPDILPTGAALFTGRGKDGKSLMVWNLCLAVATGGKALGQYDVTAGNVLYMALEDGERRAQKRLIEQMQHAHMEEPPERLDIVLWEAPRVGEGFEAALTTWLDEHPQARLVVVDILEKVRPKRTRNGSVYADDYAAIAPLQRLAQERGIAILVVHHSNKTKPDDFRDTASGSMGLIGACDTFWSLQRLAGEADAALHIIGRDVEGQELALQFKDGFWSVLGNAEEYRLSQASRAVLEVLRTAGKPLSPKQLKDLLHVPEGTLRSRLSRMVERGELLNIGENRYIPRSTSLQREGGESKEEKQEPATGATNATGATGATGATVPSLSDEKPVTVALVIEGCNGDATVLSTDKDKVLGAVRCTVAGVAGVDMFPFDGQAQSSAQGHVNGHVSLCAVCGGWERWEDRGVMRCVRWEDAEHTGGTR